MLPDPQVEFPPFPFTLPHVPSHPSPPATSLVSMSLPFLPACVGSSAPSCPAYYAFPGWMLVGPFNTAWLDTFPDAVPPLSTYLILEMKGFPFLLHISIRILC
jgi:hypothetical protein